MDAALCGQDIGKTRKRRRQIRCCLQPGFRFGLSGTLEEIAVAGAEIFHHNGGVNFTHIPCLNDSDEGMKVIETLVRRELQGWV